MFWNGFIINCCNYAGGNFATVDEMIADFRKAMEE